MLTCVRAVTWLVALLATGCAAIVSDNEGSTYIETDPEHARCELHGQDFKRVVQSPNSIHLPAKAAPLTVACTADGYITTSEELDTEIDGWIFGNLIFGGIIGVAIDAATNSGEKYPPKLMVILQPERFPNTAARDTWFDARQAKLNKRWDEVAEQIASSCKPDDVHGDCDDLKAEAEKKRQKELDRLEAKRSRAEVVSSGASGRPAGASNNSSPSGRMSEEVLLVILQRYGYGSVSEATADTLTMADDPSAKARFDNLPTAAKAELRHRAGISAEAY